MSNNQERVFLAGASGVIGRRLIPLLKDAGYHVAGMTRTAAKAAEITELGADPIVCDVFDRTSLLTAVAAFAPDIIVNELTDLPDDLADIGSYGELNARIRTEGNHNLLHAARSVETSRYFAQSVAWQLQDGPDADAVADLEQSVLAQGGVVLSYGQFYGPGTYNEHAIPAEPRVQIDRAAEMTIEALAETTGTVLITD